MANLQSTCIIGTFTLGNTQITSAPGYVWYSTTCCALQYSFGVAPSIAVRTL